MRQDSLEIEILEDGRIKTLTSKVSAANHACAEQFLQYMARLAGGETTRQHRPDALQHAHHHEHERQGS